MHYIASALNKYFPKIQGRAVRVVISKEESLNSSRAITFNFGLIRLENELNSLILTPCKGARYGGSYKISLFTNGFGSRKFYSSGI